MNKWDALKEILRLDAEAFKDQGQSFAVRAHLAVNEEERMQLEGLVQLLAFQTAAAEHYAEVMNDLDKQEEMVVNDGGSEPNEVAS